MRRAGLLLALTLLAACSSDKAAAPAPTTTTTSAPPTPAQQAASACRAYAGKDLDGAVRVSEQAAAADAAWETLHQSFEIVADFRARTANEESDANNAELLIRGPAAGQAMRTINAECERLGAPVNPA